MASILFYFIALLILALLIVVHEFGHYITGRLLGFKVLEFAVGFGPKLIKWERKGIKYSVRAIPLGGFCSFAGEDQDSRDEPGAMNNMPWYKRLIVLFSGAGFNILFAVLIGIILFWCAGYSTATIASVEAGTPIAATEAAAGDRITAVNGIKVTTADSLSQMLSQASEQGHVNLTLERDGNSFDVDTAYYRDYRYYARVEFEVRKDGIRVYSVGDDSAFTSLKKGDVVVSACGESINSAAQLYDIISSCGKEGKDLQLTLERNGECFTVSGAVVKEPFERVGVTLNYGYAPMPFGKAVISSLKAGWELCGQILSFIGKLFTGQADLSMVTGPVTTIGTMGDLVGQSAQSSAFSAFVMVLNLIWAISLNLAVFNLLPIPALDGARMVFVLIEAIFRKPVKREVEGAIHSIGFIVLILLVVALEISKIFTGVGGTPTWL